MVKCEICGKELIPEKDKVLQLREGYLSAEEDFIPERDWEYYHPSCFDEVVWPPKPKE